VTNNLLDTETERNIGFGVGGRVQVTNYLFQYWNGYKSTHTNPKNGTSDQ